MRSARKARALQSQSASSLRIVSEQLERDIRRARMVPVGSVLEGFPKMVRDLARSEGREVEFTAAGLDAEADRLVLQALKDPIMHALRNAVSHGLETPAERAAAGKSEKGRVTLTVEVAGSQLTLIVEDDGHGIDLRRVRKQAVERRLISAEEAASLRPDETRALLFQPGFSTAPTVTAVSGRGFGLSVVKETVARLQGFTRIEPRPKGGTRLRMVVPLAAASQRLLLARAGEHVFAIPARAIERVLSIPASEARVLDGKSTAWIDGQSVPLASLAGVLGLSDASVATQSGKLQVILLAAEERRMALCVDALLRESQAILKPLPFPASASPLFLGGVPLENNTIALVVNASALIDRFRGESLQARVETPRPDAARRNRILVVDDSFTARTLQRSILEAAGYDVRVAVDGVEGLAEARVGGFDAVITDIQMPRMDGFQLVEAIKEDPRLKDTPVILVTSLSDEEDRERGLSLGADAYIVKQKFDHEDLLHVIRQVL
jgi:two-component system chemotaxis sensor kinase CheA